MLLTIAAIGLGCKKDEPAPIQQPQVNEEGPDLVFKFVFDAEAPRLNNLGQPAEIPEGHAAQSPTFNRIGAHYIELAPSGLTALGAGDVLYTGPETDAGGATALDFDQSIVKSGGEEFIRIPISSVEPGTYQWIRVSLSYQNYDIAYTFGGNNYTGTVASFIGYNTYISAYQIDAESIVVNDDKLQGYWGFETTSFFGTTTTTGQAPEGATTVPNPLFDTAPIEPGSCVVTGPFENALTITGNESEDIEITLTLSTNNSFEWTEVSEDGLYEPLDDQFQPTGEVPVDMGVRGMEATVN